MKKSGIKKSTLFSVLAIFVMIPLTLYLGTRVKGRWYYLISTMIIIELMLPFFFRFEARRPQARELVILTVMAALAAVSRVVFSFSPFLKTITGIIMITGIAFGPEAGFLTGAVSAFASNFFFSQGPWTPWQMFAYGFGGFFAGLVFHRHRAWAKPWVLAPFGFFTILLLVGPLLDTCTVCTTLSQFTAKRVLAVYSAGILYNVNHGIGAALTLLFVSKPLLQKLDRLQTKYGILEI